MDVDTSGCSFPPGTESTIVVVVVTFSDKKDQLTINENNLTKEVQNYVLKLSTVLSPDTFDLHDLNESGLCIIY